MHRLQTTSDSDQIKFLVQLLTLNDLHLISA